MSNYELKTLCLAEPLCHITCILLGCWIAHMQRTKAEVVPVIMLNQKTTWQFDGQSSSSLASACHEDLTRIEWIEWIELVSNMDKSWQVMGSKRFKLKLCSKRLRMPLSCTCKLLDGKVQMTSGKQEKTQFRNIPKLYRQHTIEVCTPKLFKGSLRFSGLSWLSSNLFQVHRSYGKLTSRVQQIQH